MYSSSVINTTSRRLRLGFFGVSGWFTILLAVYTLSIPFVVNLLNVDTFLFGLAVFVLQIKNYLYPKYAE